MHVQVQVHVRALIEVVAGTYMNFKAGEEPIYFCLDNEIKKEIKIEPHESMNDSKLFKDYDTEGQSNQGGKHLYSHFFQKFMKN